MGSSLGVLFFFVRTAMGEASKGSLIHGGAELKIGFK